VPPTQGNYFNYRLGAIVGKRIGALPLPQHVGILAPHPTWGRSVISFGPEGVIEEPAWQFAEGGRFDSISYPGRLPWQIVVRRARQAIATAPYDTMDFNCDYFVRYCHGVKLGSPQVNAIALLAVIGAGFVWAAAA
jgi:hypothetical protein